MAKCLDRTDIVQRPPKGAKLLSDFMDTITRTVMRRSFELRGARFGFLAKTDIHYIRGGKNVVRKNEIKIFFTKKTLDRDIEFLENYPNPKNSYLKLKKQMAVERLKELREKAFGGDEWKK